MAKEFSENHPVYNRIGYIVYQAQSVKSILNSLLMASLPFTESGNDIQCNKRINQLFGVSNKPRRSLMAHRMACDLKMDKALITALETFIADYIYVTENLVVQSRVPVFDDLVDEVLIDRLDAIADSAIALVFDLRDLLINKQLNADAEDTTSLQEASLCVVG